MPAIFWVAFALLWVLVLVQGLALLEIIRQLVELRGATGAKRSPRTLADMVPVGEPLPPAPATLLWAEGGRAVDWSDVLGEQATALVFLNPGCASCHTVARDVSRTVASQKNGVRIVPIVTASSPERAREFVAATLPPSGSVLLDLGTEGLARSLNVNRRPAAVILRGARISGAATVLSGDHISTLLADAFREPEPQS